MSAVTRKLPQKFEWRSYFAEKWMSLYGRLGPLALTGLAMTAGLVVLVAWAGLFTVTRPERENLGRWRPFVTTADARQAIKVTYDESTGLALLAESNRFPTVISDPETRRHLRTHMERFNQAVRGRRYDPAQVPRDCVLWLEPNVSSGHTPDLKVRDLSNFDAAPASAAAAASLGAIYMRPGATPIPFLSDGYIGIFLEPGNETEKSIGLIKAGLYNAGRVTLTDAGGIPKATLAASEDGSGVLVTAQGGSAVFIDNNAPEGTGALTIGPGQMVEIAGRFFEARITDSPVLAVTAGREGGDRRIYPMGVNLHFIGPVSLTGAHQSLGIEYMFREYLEGNAAANMPPGAIWLTLDPHLQSELAQNVRELATNGKHQIASGMRIASGMMMNARTGAILAMAAEQDYRYDPGNLDEVYHLLDGGQDRYANHGCFRRHVIGSLTKPFFAFAALNLIPNVTDMEIQVTGSETKTLFGHRLYGDRAHTFKYPKRNHIDFPTYLIHSDNTYQHSLGLLLMAGVTDLDALPTPWRTESKAGGNLIRPTGSESMLAVGALGAGGANRLRIVREAPLAQTMRRLFDLETASGAEVLDDRDIALYGSLINVASAILLRRYPDQDPNGILLRRSAVCAPEFPRMALEDVANTMDASNILFGANRNHWTDVKLCESFSRMITGRKVKARLVQRYLDTTAGGTPVDLESEAPGFTIPDEVRDASVFAEMRKQLEQVPLQGTAELLRPVITEMRAQPGMRRFRLFAKTGTIDDGKPDSKLMLGTFGLWDESQQAFEGDALTFVFYLKNALDEDAIHKLVRANLPLWWHHLNPHPDEAR